MAETVTTEVTEFDDGSKIVETKTVESEYIEGDTPPLEIETVAEPIIEASVEIAEIEAGRDIALAEIRAETEIAHIEANAEIVAEATEDREWRRNIEVSLAELQTAVLDLAGRLTPPPSTEPELLPTNPSSESEGALPAAEVVEAEVVAEAPPEPPKRLKKLRWI